MRKVSGHKGSSSKCNLISVMLGPILTSGTRVSKNSGLGIEIVQNSYRNDELLKERSSHENNIKVDHVQVDQMEILSTKEKLDHKSANFFYHSSVRVRLS